MAVAVIPRPPQAVLPRQRARLTLEEFRALPEGPPFYEFEQGELIPMPRPHSFHQAVLRELLVVMTPHIKARQLGDLWPEIEVELSPERTYVPDLVYLSSEHLDRHSDQDGRIYGAPDLVVEILSEGTARRDRTVKYNAYREAGVAWYWIVDPDDLTIEEYRLMPEGYLGAQRIGPGEPFQPGLFPGLTLNLAELLGMLAPLEAAGEE